MIAKHDAMKATVRASMKATGSPQEAASIAKDDYFAIVGAFEKAKRIAKGIPAPRNPAITMRQIYLRLRAEAYKLDDHLDPAIIRVVGEVLDGVEEAVERGNWRLFVNSLYHAVAKIKHWL